MYKLYADFKFNCNDTIKQYCIDFLNSHWDFQEEKIFRLDMFVKELSILHKEIKDRGLPPLLSMSIFCRGPGHNQGIHIDTVISHNTTVKSNANFYIPLHNTGGKLVWFDLTKGYELGAYADASVNSHNQKTHSLNVIYPLLSEPPVIGEYTGFDPVIINTLIPHRAESSEHPRAALSFRLQGNPDLFKLLNL